jgi:hypothetical protein
LFPQIGGNWAAEILEARARKVPSDAERPCQR